MKVSLVFIISVVAATAYAQAYSSDDGLESRAFAIVEDHHARSDILSDLTTRELVEELEGRLEGRGAGSIGLSLLKGLKLPSISSKKKKDRQPKLTEGDRTLTSDTSPSLSDANSGDAQGQ